MEFNSPFGDRSGLTKRWTHPGIICIVSLLQDILTLTGQSYWQHT